MCDKSAAEGSAAERENASLAPDLQAIIDDWQTLPESVKADILAMVKAGGLQQREPVVLMPRQHDFPAFCSKTIL
jgi:uncharacterized protein CbrC (UPF0167 family)